MLETNGIIEIDVSRPLKLYRYSERKWLERSLKFGEFRLRPASDYKHYETDKARHDDELVRVFKSPADSVTISVMGTAQIIKPIGDIVYRSETQTDYLTICFSERWDEYLFNDFPNTDSCLIIHDVEEFCERLYSSVELTLPQWIGIDAPIVYGGRSGLGAIFSKPLRFVSQHEWRFAWLSKAAIGQLNPVNIQIGSIVDIAEIVGRPNHDVYRL